MFKHKIVHNNSSSALFFCWLLFMWFVLLEGVVVFEWVLWMEELLESLLYVVYTSSCMLYLHVRWYDDTCLTRHALLYRGHRTLHQYWSVFMFTSSRSIFPHGFHFVLSYCLNIIVYDSEFVQTFFDRTTDVTGIIWHHLFICYSACLARSNMFVPSCVFISGSLFPVIVWPIVVHVTCILNLINNSNYISNNVHVIETPHHSYLVYSTI